MSRPGRDRREVCQEALAKLDAPCSGSKQGLARCGPLKVSLAPIRCRSSTSGRSVLPTDALDFPTDREFEPETFRSSYVVAGLETSSTHSEGNPGRAGHYYPSRYGGALDSALRELTGAIQERNRWANPGGVPGWASSELIGPMRFEVHPLMADLIAPRSGRGRSVRRPPPSGPERHDVRTSANAELILRDAELRPIVSYGGPKPGVILPSGP